MSQAGKQIEAGKKSNKCPAKECFRNFCSKHPIAIQRAKIITGTIGGITIVVFMIPFVINELYKMGPGYVTEWHAEDVLSFYGALLSCVGTVVLGVVAIKQNDRSNQLNEQLQKIQQAEYVSMVEAKSIFLEKRSSATPSLRQVLFAKRVPVKQEVKPPVAIWLEQTVR